MRILRFIGILMGWVVAAGCVTWATGALLFDFPWLHLRTAIAVTFLLLVVALIVWVRKPLKMLVPFVAMGIILGWWFTLQPRNDRAWQPDVDRTASAEVNGDEVTFHNIRNCEYRTEFDYTPRWETRTVRMSQLTGVDLAITYWGSPWIAHPIASFQFADAPPLCFSIETRKEIGESYSAIGGLYRQYELIYIVAEERDVIRLRSNYRKGEEVFLYRLALRPDQVRERFLDYVKVVNGLHAQPRWYNASTTNCTTSIRDQHAAQKRVGWNWRILLNGKMDEWMFEHGSFVSAGSSFPEFKQRSHINALARAANDAPDFWQRIRIGLPWTK